MKTSPGLAAGSSSRLGLAGLVFLPVFPVGRAGMQLAVSDKQTRRYIRRLFIDDAGLGDNLNQEALIVSVLLRSGFPFHKTGTGYNHLARQIIELQRGLLLIREPKLEK